jgi:hypothetical protein
MTSRGIIRDHGARRARTALVSDPTAYRMFTTSASAKRILSEDKRARNRCKEGDDAEHRDLPSAGRSGHSLASPACHLCAQWRLRTPDTPFSKHSRGCRIQTATDTRTTVVGIAGDGGLGRETHRSKESRLEGEVRLDDLT